MPYRISTSRHRGGAPAALCRVVLALLHLSVVATAHAAQQTLGIQQTISQPYLVASNAPALRFRAAASTLPLVRKPVATGSPVAASPPEIAEVTLANNHAAASTPPIPLSTPETPEAQPAPEKKPEPPPAPAAKAQPILPDDTRRKVQSQDFLPLFRFPGSGAAEESTVASPPAPGTLPPSSATYRQQ